MATGISHLPVELLLKIFALLRKQHLAAVRLTSKHLNDVASQIYLDSITIALRRQTLVDLDTIIRHPVLKKGVRCVTFDISQYDDGKTVKEVYAQRLVAKLEEELEDHLRYACSHHQSKSLVRLFRRHTCKKGVLCNPERISDLQDWIKTCEWFSTGWTRNKPWFNRRAASIFDGYKRYCELAKDQKLLSQSQAHVRLLERVLENMPLIKSLRVVDLSKAVLRSSITFDNRNGHNAFCLDRTLIVDPLHMADFRLDRILLAWVRPGLRLEEFTCRESGALLQMLPDQLTHIPPPVISCGLRHVITLNLKIGHDKENSRAEHHFVAIGKLSSGALSVMLLQAKSLQSFTLDGGESILVAFALWGDMLWGSTLALDNIIAPSPWSNLKHVALKRLIVNFDGFMTFCSNQRTTLVNLTFDDVLMEEGTWRAAIEMFRTDLSLETIRFCGIRDSYDGLAGFTDAEEAMMARYVLNREQDLLSLWQ